MSQWSMKKQKTDPIWTFCLLALVVFGYMVVMTLMVEADTSFTFADLITKDEVVMEATVPEGVPQGEPKKLGENPVDQEEQMTMANITPSEPKTIIIPTEEETTHVEEEEPVQPAQAAVMPIFGGTTEVAEGMVVFNDLFFEACIRFVLNKPKGDITKEELMGITTLDLGSHFITDITGIADMPHLKTLILNDNTIRDLTPLSGLKELETLELQNNAITDISSLKNLTSLIYLDISGNEVEDFTPLLGLVQLNTLYVTENKVIDFSPLAQLQHVINRDYEPSATNNDQKITYDELPLEEDPVPQENQTSEPTVDSTKGLTTDPMVTSPDGQVTEEPVINLP